jgi:16S rRNA C967 or C1407 C5-methylase (RsmB/RsmF family)
MITKEELENLIKKEYPNDYISIMEGFEASRNTSFRLNRLTSDKEEVDKFLLDNNIKFKNPTFFSDAYILDEKIDLSDTTLFKEAKIYLQSLSSQIPPLFLDLDINNDILDMCAAPGGKTCEIASLTMNQKNIMAVEANKIRADRLKYNLNLQGVSRANVFVKDSKKLDSFFRFDTILLDAPCSGSGTINLNNPRDLQSFSLDLVKNSSKTQKELLKKAIEILKLGHTMVYSTCSILKIENEEVVKSVLGPNVVVEPIELDIDKSNLLPSTIDGVITVKPSDKYEGFFIAKLRKIK